MFITLYIICDWNRIKQTITLTLPRLPRIKSFEISFDRKYVWNILSHAVNRKGKSSVGSPPRLSGYGNLLCKIFCLRISIICLLFKVCFIIGFINNIFQILFKSKRIYFGFSLMLFEDRHLMFVGYWISQKLKKCHFNL